MSEFNQNNLQHSLSPYLLQHAAQPVNWQPWDNETLEHAKQTQRPILLSIGYSACHWCHVMARESFSTEQTAGLMNQSFVNIKLDREERPDLDQIYQQAHQILNQRGGGWPLTVFLEPNNLQPFFVGTYFPPEPRNGMVSFEQLLESITTIFNTKQDDVLQISQQVSSALQTLNHFETAADDLPILTDNFIQQFLQQADGDWGGLQGAPKFPQVAIYQSLLNLLILKRPEQKEEIYRHLMLTAQSMSKIGLFDQLAGGFFRYCVDHHWGVPHFEKMLSDNAQLLSFYADLAQFNKEGILANICLRTFQWLRASMLSDEGGFYSTLDAETEGEEGKYYVWDKQQIKTILTDNEYRLADVAFGLQQAPNFNEQWHLHQWYSYEKLAEKLGMELKQVQWQLDPICQKLLEIRNKRAAPHRDEKITTSWNALLISGLYKSGRLLNNASIINTADNCLEFIYQNLWVDDHLFSCYKDHVAYEPAFLDDYAFLGQALIESLSYEWNSQRFSWLIQIIDQMTARFKTDCSGLKFSDRADIKHHPMSFSDGALVNSNAIAAQVLTLLSIVCNNSEYGAIANTILKSASQPAQQSPLAHASIISAIEFKAHIRVAVIRGNTAEVIQWKSQLIADLHPATQIFAIPNSILLTGKLAEKYPPQEITAAIVCDHKQCHEAITDDETLRQLLFE